MPEKRSPLSSGPADAPRHLRPADPAPAVRQDVTPLTRVAEVAGAVPGAVLGAVFGVTAKVRGTKPLHPVGHVGEGILEVLDPDPGFGVPLLASAGTHRCTVRWSRAMGLPSPLPDFEGLAVRFEDQDADLLFASTGTGSVSRFLLVPRPAGRHGPQTTLLPLATDSGSLLLRVTPRSDATEPPRRFDLSVAHSAREWRAVGTLRVDEWGPDRPTRFDPVRNLLPGTEQYPLVRFLREPAYLMARRGSDART
jgi:hypothetical protein